MKAALPLPLELLSLSASHGIFYKCTFPNGIYDSTGRLLVALSPKRAEIQE